MKKNKKGSVNFDDITTRIDYSRRGGGMEISCDDLGEKYAGVKMTAYCNYLGGGMLGAVMGDCNRDGWKNDPELAARNEELKRYFHALVNEEASDWDEWSGSTYEANQERPKSAY